MAISSSARSTPPEHLTARPAPASRVASPAAPALALACALAREPAELRDHYAIRREVFVETQRLFAHDDRDARDARPETLHAVALAGADVVGAVRFYPLDGDGRWKGDRLAVLPAERALQLGAMLVRFAVRGAGERGGRIMVAQVQVPNVRFFERLGWRRDGDVAAMFGVDHQPMAIGLGPVRGLSRVR